MFTSQEVAEQFAEFLPDAWNMQLAWLERQRSRRLLAERGHGLPAFPGLCRRCGRPVMIAAQSRGPNRRYCHGH